MPAPGRYFLVEYLQLQRIPAYPPPVGAQPITEFNMTAFGPVAVGLAVRGVIFTRVAHFSRSRHQRSLMVRVTEGYEVPVPARKPSRSAGRYCIRFGRVFFVLEAQPGPGGGILRSREAADHRSEEGGARPLGRTG